jgi:hypothetical protein
MNLMPDETISGNAAADHAAIEPVNAPGSSNVVTEHVHGEHGGGHGGRSELRAISIAVMGWIIPGLGHALQKMWGRALAIFLTVGFLVYLGAGMRGNLFAPDGEDAFAKLGYAADVGTGSFYLLARMLESSGADVSHADGDYGTRFLATAGVLNLFAALHAYEAARGRKA